MWIFFILMMVEFSSTISLSFYYECDVSSGFLGTFPFSAFNHFQKFPLPEEYCAVNGRMWPRGARSLQNISKSCLTLAWLEKVVWAAGGAGSVASWRDERARESRKAHRLAGDTRWRMEGGEHQKRILLVLSALMKVCFISFSPLFLYVYVFVFVCVFFVWISSRLQFLLDVVGPDMCICEYVSCLLCVCRGVKFFCVVHLHVGACARMLYIMTSPWGPTSGCAPWLTPRQSTPCKGQGWTLWRCWSRVQ